MWHVAFCFLVRHDFISPQCRISIYIYIYIYLEPVNILLFWNLWISFVLDLNNIINPPKQGPNSKLSTARPTRMGRIPGAQLVRQFLLLRWCCFSQLVWNQQLHIFGSLDVSNWSDFSRPLRSGYLKIVDFFSQDVRRFFVGGPVGLAKRMCILWVLSWENLRQFHPLWSKRSRRQTNLCVLFPMWSSKKMLLNFSRVPNVYHEHAMVSSDIYILTYIFIGICI